MNSVHEPGPNGDSETIPSRKPGQKLSQVHEHPTGPTGHPGTPRCARCGRIVGLGPAVSWPGPAVSQHTGCRIVGGCACAKPRAPARLAVSCRRLLQPCRGRGLGHVTAPVVVSQALGRAPGWCVVLQHSPVLPPLACHNTICLYCDTGFLTSLAACCNTIHCIAT